MQRRNSSTVQHENTPKNYLIFLACNPTFLIWHYGIWDMYFVPWNYSECGCQVCHVFPALWPKWTAEIGMFFSHMEHVLQKNFPSWGQSRAGHRGRWLKYDVNIVPWLVLVLKESRYQRGALTSSNNLSTCWSIAKYILKSLKLFTFVSGTSSWLGLFRKCVKEWGG